MDVLGWVLFVIGALPLIVFAFIGIDAGRISVTNLAGTLVGSAMMISGAVFITGDKVVRAIKGETEEDVQILPLPPVPKEVPRDTKTELFVAAIAAIIFGGLFILFWTGVRVE